MHKDNLISQINQDCHQRKLINRRNKKIQAYASFTKDPNLKELKDALTRSMRGRKQIFHKLLNLIMQYSRYGVELYANEKTIAKKFDCSEKALSRVIGQAADMGIIHAKQRGFNETNKYFLNPAMKKPSVQHALTPFFSFLKVFALHLLFSSASHTNLDARLVKFKTTDVTLIKKGCSFLNRQRSVNEQTHKNPESYINICGSVESCVKDRGVTEIFYWSRGEKIAREGQQYAVDPRDMCINNGSIECLFVQGNALLEATSESFDNHVYTESYVGLCKNYVTEWEKDMHEAAPYLTDAAEWEEFDDPQVGDDDPEAPETEWDISYPNSSDEEIAVSDDEVEMAFEGVKIQIDSMVPVIPVDTGERLISNPTKPWNAPAWRKVGGQGDVETFTEFINRVTKKKGNYD